MENSLQHQKDEMDKLEARIQNVKQNLEAHVRRMVEMVVNNSLDEMERMYEKRFYNSVII